MRSGATFSRGLFSRNPKSDPLGYTLCVLNRTIHRTLLAESGVPSTTMLIVSANNKGRQPGTLFGRT